MTSAREMTHRAWITEAVRRFGLPAQNWRFKCVQCGTEQTLTDLLAAGLDQDKASSTIGFSCIGRFKKGVGCDWTLGGLFQLHTLEVVREDGSRHPIFEFADVETPAHTAEDAETIVAKKIEEHGL